MLRLLIIGGSDAGISAALRARELDAAAEVTVLVADSFPNFSICGLPYFLSGEVPDWRQLAHRTLAEVQGMNVQILLDHIAKSIDPQGKTVTVQFQGQTKVLPYDRLIIATGARAIAPPIEGLHLPGVFSLHMMADGLAMHEFIDRHSPASAIIIGGGYIGMEMAEALSTRGLTVTVVDHGRTVLKTVDPELGGIVRNELLRHQVEVVNGVGVAAIERHKEKLSVRAGGFVREADIVLVSGGVQPNTTLAKAAGISTGVKDAIRVSRRMETNLPDIYAAGDCAETWHTLLQKDVYLPLGTTAHKQGRVAGENAVGGSRTFAGSLGTQVIKVFDLAVARTGLNDPEAKAAGYDPLTVESVAWDRKAYYPGARELRMRITGDRQTGCLLGAQMIGHKDAEVAKRIDIFAAASFNGMRVDSLNDLDLSYSPPFGSPWDAVQVGAQIWDRANESAST